jgi:hypothetical protein
MLCAAALCFWGCESVIDAAKGKAFGTIKLKLSIGEAPKAANNISGPLFTIYPGEAEAFGNFTLSFEPTQDGAAHSDVSVDDISAPITISDIVLGVYTVTVTATRSSDSVVVAMGSLTGVAVTEEADPDEEETVNVILGPKTGNGLSDGTFSYNITFTETMTAATLTITDADGAGVGDAINLLEDDGAGTKALAPGYYYVDVTTNSNVGGGEVIHIYSGMTSAWTKQFTAGPPPPPVGAVGFTAGFAHDEIPVTVAPESAKVVQGGV